MTMFKLMTAAAAVAGVAAPAAAQVPYGYPQSAYPNQYGYPSQYGHPNQYGYPNQGTGVIGQVIDQLLGNRYNVTDRWAISQCANAAMIQAQTQYRGYSYGRSGYGYPQGYGYGQPVYGQGFAAPAMRVTAITDVQRRSSGLRVKGLMSSGYAGQYGNQYGQYGNQYGYNQNRYYAAGDLTFRCNVDYRGVVTRVKISANNSAYRRY